MEVKDETVATFGTEVWNGGKAYFVRNHRSTIPSCLFQSEEEPHHCPRKAPKYGVVLGLLDCGIGRRTIEDKEEIKTYLRYFCQI